MKEHHLVQTPYSYLGMRCFIEIDSRKSVNVEEESKIFVQNESEAMAFATLLLGIFLIFFLLHFLLDFNCYLQV
jgi:hypothetical protein